MNHVVFSGRKRSPITSEEKNREEESIRLSAYRTLFIANWFAIIANSGRRAYESANIQLARTERKEVELETKHSCLTHNKL